MEKKLTETESRLLEIAQNPPFDRFPDALFQAHKNRMERFGHRDWPAYVPEPLRVLWPSLSLETRLAVFACAVRLVPLDDMAE